MSQRSEMRSVERFAFWTPTFSGKDTDFTGRVDGLTIGRITKIGGGLDRWRWRMFAFDLMETAETGLSSGIAVGTRKEVERHVEAVYLRWKAAYGR